MGELLRRGFDVYMTLVDDQQIDCIVRIDGPKGPSYRDVQIKARSNDCKPKQGGVFAALEIRNPRRGFFFIFYSERAQHYWIIPSLDIPKLAYRNKSGKNKGKFRLQLATLNSKGDLRPRPRFTAYEDNFDLLKTGR
jgi:hypothetical protein